MFKDIVQKRLCDALGRASKIADVGLELEIEGMGLPDTAPHWQVKGEGSLQNGFEYITKPIKEDAVEVYVDNLQKFFDTMHAVVKPSYRCSTHIHCNMLPEKFSDVLGFMVVYYTFEPIFLTLCGNQRNGNLFCMSSYDTGDTVIAFNNLCRNIHNSPTDGLGYQRGKYAALNFDRLWDLGTIEIRSFPLSTKGKEVSMWVKWLMAMRNMARAETDKTYRGFWKSVRQNPTWHAMKVFGDHSDLYRIPNLTELLEVGTQNAYELTRCLRKWYAEEKAGAGRRRRVTKKTLFDPVSLDETIPSEFL